MEKFLGYAKAAFLDRWHLLVLGAVTAFALISPVHLDVSLPLITAAEIAFLASIASNPRFQRSIDARTGAVDDARKQQIAEQRFNKLYYGLDADSQRLFSSLRHRCEILNEVVPHETDATDMVSESQALGVNKLLWVYLKLLHTRMNLNKFLKSIDERDLDNQLAQSRSRIETVEKENGPSKEKMLHSLQDTLQTIQARKDNFRKARDNFEYVGLELERIATKLTALAELAVNRQDPATITTGVDEVAKSVETTEQTIGDLRVFTGLTAEDEVAPQIMDRKVQERRVRA
jgi:hypothetical protein